MIIKSTSMTKATIQVGNTSLFLYEIGGHLAIMPTWPQYVAGEGQVRFKKGSLSFRINKGMKLKHAIKDLIAKGKNLSTEIILIDTRD